MGWGLEADGKNIKKLDPVYMRMISGNVGVYCIYVYCGGKKIDSLHGSAVDSMACWVAR